MAVKKYSSLVNKKKERKKISIHSPLAGKAKKLILAPDPACPEKGSQPYTL